MTIDNKKPDLFTILKRRNKSIQQFLCEKYAKNESTYHIINELKNSYTISDKFLKEVEYYTTLQKEQFIKNTIKETKRKEEEEKNVDIGQVVEKQFKAATKNKKTNKS